MPPPIADPRLDEGIFELLDDLKQRLHRLEISRQGATELPLLDQNPSAPPAGALIYAVLNGFGKIEVRVRYAGGLTQVLATQP